MRPSITRLSITRPQLSITRIAGLIACLGLSATSLVLAQSSVPAPDEPATGMHEQDHMYINNKAEGSLTNEKFVKQAAKGGLLGIEASRLALERSQDPKIREYATLMVNEHTTVSEELQSIAAAKHIPVPEKADLLQDAKLAMLKVDKGKTFDKAYTKQMIKDHDETVALFERAAKSDALDSDLRSFAEKNLAVLREHQKRAHDVLGAAQKVSQN